MPDVNGVVLQQTTILGTTGLCLTMTYFSALSAHSRNKQQWSIYMPTIKNKIRCNYDKAEGCKLIDPNCEDCVCFTCYSVCSCCAGMHGVSKSKFKIDDK